MRNVFKKVFAFMLVLALSVTTLTAASAPTEVKAASNYKTLYESGASYQYAYAYTPTTEGISFTVDSKSEIYFILETATSANATANILDLNGNLVDSFAISTPYSDYDYTYGYTYYYGGTSRTLAAGTYMVNYVFDTDNQYWTGIYKDSYKMNQTTATITVGFTTKLSVNGIKVKKWKSSNKKVATVNKKGKVTAKKAGKCTITAVLANGEKVTCKVTVKKNQFKDSKLTASDVPYGKGYLGIHSMKYDSKGNLVLKCRFANNSGHRVSQLKNIKITIISEKGKKIGVYKFTKGVSISHGSTKDFTFTIKKSNLKIKKKSDLRGATYKVTGDFYYYY